MSCVKETSDYPHPDKNPFSEMMYSGGDPEAIDFEKLPVIDGEHAVVAKGHETWHFRLHTYLKC